MFSSRSRTRTYVVAFFLGMFLGTGYLPSSESVEAQRDISQETLRRFGSRLVLPSLQGLGAANDDAEIHVTNVGWKPVDVLAIALAPAPGVACQTDFDSSRILDTVCGKDIGRMAVKTLNYSGSKNASMLFYTGSSEATTRLCKSFEAVENGQTSFADWERDVFDKMIGDPIAVRVTTAGQEESLIPQTSMRANPSNRDFARLIENPYLGIPGVWGRNTHTHIANMMASCVNLSTRSSAHSPDECDTPLQSMSPQVSAFSGLNLKVPAAGGVDARINGAAGALITEMSASTTIQDARGRAAYVTRAQSGGAAGRLAFPLGLIPEVETKTELWVTNHHITRSVTVNIQVYDGNRTTIRNYNDLNPLCAGATRRYDINEIVGEIPPTSGRGDRNTAPQMSMRVEASAPGLGIFAPISGLMVLDTAEGIVAYPGQSTSFESRIYRGRRDQPGSGSPLFTIVPGVKHRVGPNQVTTLLTTMTLENAQQENTVTIDFYDQAGTLVLSGFTRNMGNGPSAYIDLRQVAVRQGDQATRLPVGFVGTAVVRGARNPNIVISAIALERPAAGVDQPRPRLAQAGSGDNLSAYAGIQLPSWPNPDLPTPTARPTQVRVTPTATGEQPTSEPTEESTPTAMSEEKPHKVMMPALWKNVIIGLESQ